MTIRTPDQRLRVFVSSTLAELGPEREAAREAVEALRLAPVMFELGARPHPPRALYRAYLEQSDVFVGIYWERYGWVAPGEEISGLEDEYRLSGERPKLIYLKEPAPAREPRLSELLDRIRADDRASYRRFSDGAELRRLVADDLAVLLTERFSASAGAQGFGLPSARRALPRPLTRLIGRERDVARVRELLADSSRRLLTLVGPGGIGKTRLALAAAEEVRERYRDGVAYVELGSVAEPGLLLPTIAEAIGLREGSGVSVGMALRAALADAQMLLVLDGIEQLTDAVPDLADLLAAAPGVQMLVTSRRVLNITGEHVLRVEPLQLQASGGSHSASVELFLDRARTVRPGFEPDPTDLEAIAEVTRRLDGVPLAIELATSRLRVLSPPMLLERMGHHRLPFLRGGGRDLPARQQTLRDTIAWSHSLLPAEARTLFARLAVFVGSADLRAIEEVADPDGRLDVLELLAALVDASLVRALGEAGEPRFGMLETIREFAVEQLEASGEAELYRARHQDHYIAVAERGATEIGGHRQLELLERFTREIDNFRAVLRRAMRRGDASAGIRLGLALAAYWQLRSSFAEGRAWMRGFRELPTATPYERAAAWTPDALLAFWQGDFELDSLGSGVDDVVAVLSEAGDHRTLGFALLVKSLVVAAERGPEAGAAVVVDASAHLDAERDPFLHGIGLLTRSYVERLGGRLDRAGEHAREAHRISRRSGDWFIRSVASMQLATVALETGDTDSVRRHALESLLGAQKLRNLGSAAFSLEIWAAAELRDGRAERAGRLYSLARWAYREVSARPWRTEARLHRQVQEGVQQALGAERVAAMEAQAAELDFDAAVTELATSQPREAGSVAKDRDQPVPPDSRSISAE